MKNQIELLQDLLWEIRELRKAVENKNEERTEIPELDEKPLGKATWTLEGAEFKPIQNPARMIVEIYFGNGGISRRIRCSNCKEELPNDKLTLDFNMCPFCGYGFTNGGKT